MKEILGFEGLYAVSRNGEVLSLVHNASRRKGPLKPYTNTGGYQRVNLYDAAGRVSKRYVHRLVAQAYIPNPIGLPAVNHINANKRDNSVENLEWCDAEHNIAESRRLGLQRDRKTIVIDVITGDCCRFLSLKDAARALTGKPWAFTYAAKTNGPLFCWGRWLLEVMSK